MNYRHLLSCLLLGLVSLKGFGQDSTALSLPQLWEQAFSHYPSLNAYQAKLKQANIQQKLVKNQALPEVHLQLQNTIGSQEPVGGSFFPSPGIFNTGASDLRKSGQPAANLFGSIVMDWKFMQFGRQRKSAQAAGMLTEQTQYQLEAERLAIQAALSRTYFQVLFHQQMQAWAVENNKRLESLFDASKSMAQSGLSPGADSLLVKASLKQTEALLEDWQGKKEESDLLLAMWLNQSADQLNINNESFFSTAVPEDLAVEEEKTIPHPHLQFKDAQIRYAGKLKELTAVSALPTVSLLGGVQWRGNAAAQGAPLVDNWLNSYHYPVGNYLVGVGLRWNMGNLFNYKLDMGRQEEEILQRQAEAEALSLNLNTQHQIAQRQLVQGKKQIENAEQAFEAASEAFHLFENRYSSGLISITELLQIQDILQNTEKTRIEAYYQYWIQQVDRAESRADFSFLQHAFK